MTDPFNPCPLRLPLAPVITLSLFLRKMSRIFAWKIRIIRSKLQQFSMRKGCQPFAQITDYRSRVLPVFGFKFYTFTVKMLGKFKENSIDLRSRSGSTLFVQQCNKCRVNTLQLSLRLV